MTNKEQAEYDTKPWSSFSQEMTDQVNRKCSSVDFHKSTKSHSDADDDFEMIDKNEIKYNCYSLGNKYFQSEKKRSLLRSSIVIENSDTKTSNSASVWSKFTNQISSMKNNLKYNYVSTKYYVDFNNINYIKVFDQVFTEEQIKGGDMFKFLLRIIQMTYRSNFKKLSDDRTSYTSDCGWGCMIRAAQMMLSKAVLENKIFHYINQHKTNQLNEMDILKMKIESILLFYDNNVKIEDIIENKDFKSLFSNISLIISDEEKKLNEKKTDKILNNFEFYNDKNMMIYASEVTPPFSIQNICKLAKDYDKGPGIWFSDVLMASIFQELNKQFNPIEDTEIAHFNDGVVDEEKILSECFEEVHCFDDCETYFNSSDYYHLDIEEFINKIQIDHNERQLCGSCESRFLSDKERAKNYLKKGNRIFKFKKGGIVMVSVRHGLESINLDYVDSICQIFNIKNNIGIIGGKANEAHYFIGQYKDQLVYLDPHINQNSLNNKSDLYDSHSMNSYTPKHLYHANVSTISPAFTAGFMFRSLHEFNKLMESFLIHSHFHFPVFTFRSLEFSQNKHNSSKKIKFLEQSNEEDFCIIDYEEEEKHD